MSKEAIEIKTRNTAIDLTKLHKLKDWRLILSMLRLYNDLSFVPMINTFLATKPLEDLNLITGVKWHLLRWRIAMMAEAVANVIKPLKSRESDPDSEIWSVIRGNNKLVEHWKLIEDSFDKGHKNSLQLNRAKMVRDKLTVHYDKELVNMSFDKYLGLNPSDQLLGWHVQGTPEIARNLFIDELLNLVFFEIYEINVYREGVDEESLAKATKPLQDFLSAVANFINELFIEYCEKNALVIPDATPEWLA